MSLLVDVSTLRVAYLGPADQLVRQRAVLGATHVQRLEDAATATVLCMAAPADARFRLAEAALKKGLHLLLAWPPTASLTEAEALVRLGEEAGVEIGVSRPLRFHPEVARWPKRAQLVHLTQVVPEATQPPPWARWMADAVDLCCALAQSHSVQRIDAEAVRGDVPWPAALGAGLRFHSGTYAQLHVRRAPTDHRYQVYLGRGAQQQVIDLTTAQEEAAAAEARAFARAVAEGRPPPVSMLEAFHTLRLVERLMTRLR